MAKKNKKNWAGRKDHYVLPNKKVKKMRRKIITLCFLTLVIYPILNVSALNINAPPNAPIITGETVGIIGTSYNYSIKSSDPNNENVYYKIIWGDCEVVNNAGPFKSGEEVIFSHSWCEICSGPGKYTIQVKAFDKDGGESVWGTLDVEMKADNDKPLFSQRPPTFFEMLIKLFKDLF